MMTNTNSKIAVKELITQQQIDLVKDLEASIKNLKEDSDLDEDALKDMEDFSHQSESKELERRLQEQLHTAKTDLHFIQNYSENPCDNVQVGAFVKTDKNNFYVCISCPPIAYEGQNLIGISEKAPIYAQMAGLKKGDTFEMAKVKYKILEVF